MGSLAIVDHSLDPTAHQECPSKYHTYPIWQDSVPLFRNQTRNTETKTLKMVTFTLFHIMLWWDCGRALAIWEPTAAGFFSACFCLSFSMASQKFSYFFSQKLLLLLVSREASVIVWSLSKHVDTKHTVGPGL